MWKTFSPDLGRHAKWKRKENYCLLTNTLNKQQAITQHKSKFSKQSWLVQCWKMKSFIIMRWKLFPIFFTTQESSITLMIRSSHTPHHLLADNRWCIYMYFLHKSGRIKWLVCYYCYEQTHVVIMRWVKINFHVSASTESMQACRTHWLSHM